MSANKNDDLDSARILIQENLLDEAKRVLFRLVSFGPDPRAQALLRQIEAIEMNELIRTPAEKNKSLTEDANLIISKLENDLKITRPGLETEQWSISIHNALADARTHFDLGVAFFEMSCYADAVRELKKAEKKIRIESSFLGELGVSVVALIAESLILLEKAFDAKIYLDPILLEPDLPHEQKIVLYYTMGLAEQALEEPKSALGWFNKVMQSDPSFRDVEHRVKILTKT